MDGHGRAEAPAAGTVLNALATGTGSAFAIDRYVRAAVSLDDSDQIEGRVAGDPGADTALVERCVELVVERFGDGENAGGAVETESEVPMASGLKSSSAAANAAVLAALDAVGADLEREDAARLGVRAARETGVTVTGAFDDASASMLGGLTVTNNDEDALLARENPDWDVLVHTPPEQAFSADADAERCARIAPVAEHVADLAHDGRHELAMTLNGFAYCAALSCSPDPAVAALPAAAGVSLSGTGPSYVAVGERAALETIDWHDYDGDTWLTTTQTDGARTI
jgi:shikimate kinase